MSITNPHTGRKIKVGGPTYLRLVAENRLMPIPKKQYPMVPPLIQLVYNRLKPRVLLRLLSLQPSLIENENFWRTYLNRDQERLHLILREAAKHNYGGIFMYLWHTPIVYYNPPQTMIKEHRSLLSGFVTAYLAGHRGTAWLVYGLDPFIKNKITVFYPHDITITNKNKLAILEQRMEMQLAATAGDSTSFTDHYEKLSSLVSKYEDTSLIDDYLIESLEMDSSETNSVQFIREIVNKDVTLETVAAYLLNLGKYEFVKQLITDGVLKRNEVDWSDLIFSKRDDAVEIIKREEGNPKPAETVLDDLVDAYSLSELESPALFISYIRRHPEDKTILLGSFSTLPTNEYLELYLSISKCITDAEVREASEFSSVQEMLRYWREEVGYEYLAQEFERRVPICS